MQEEAVAPKSTQVPPKGFQLSDAKAQGEVIVRGLTKHYGSLPAVADVSFRAAPGEFVTLIGPSGSGKTTTLMMIAGFIDPDDGAIMLDGLDIAHKSPQERQLGMVFQNYAIFPHMTVFENVAFPLRVRKMKREEITKRVAWALRTVKLDALADRAPRQLSGGQQQRVALARAIVFHPSIILMDEPLGALDKNLRYHLQVELKVTVRPATPSIVGRCAARLGRLDADQAWHGHWQGSKAVAHGPV